MPKQKYITKEKMTFDMALALACLILRNEALEVTNKFGHNHPYSRELREAIKLLEQDEGY